MVNKTFYKVAFSDKLWEEFCFEEKIAYPVGINYYQKYRSCLILRKFFIKCNKTLDYCFCVENLNLSDNKLTEVPSELSLLTKLQKLELSDNQLTKIPSEFSKLTNLKELYLDNNRLVNVPAEFSTLTNLQILWLSHNQLTNIPSILNMTTNLKKLYLSNNLITDVPSKISVLTNLEILWLSHNRYLTVSPTEIKRMLPNLKTFSFHNDPIFQS